MQVLIFAGCTSFAVSRLVFSFAYSCIDIFLGFRIAFCVFRCLDNLFHWLTECYLADYVFAHNCAGLIFSPFGWGIGRYLFAFVFVRSNEWFMRALVNAVCACYPFLIFLAKISQDMMCRENSRPPGPPNHACTRPPAPNLPHPLYIVNQYTHTHAYIPIYTHLHRKQKK